MNIAELKKDRYDALKTLSKTDREATIKTITYLETLASKTGADITGWDILATFGRENAPLHLIGSKNELNKRFFETQEKQLNPDTGLSDEIRKKLKTHAESVDKNWKQRKINEHRLNQQSYLSRARQYHLEANTYVSHAFMCAKEILKLENRSFDSTEQAMEILKDTFWKFRDVQGNCLNFDTVNEVILTEINPAANINIQVNVGKFVASIDVANAKVNLLPMSTFVPGARVVVVEASGGHYHPHIDTSGGPCWGDGSAAAAQYLAAGQFAEMMRLLTALITTYSPQRPYAALAHFKSIADKMDGAVKNEPEKEQENQATQLSGLGQIRAGYAPIQWGQASQEIRLNQLQINQLNQINQTGQQNQEF